MKVYTLILMTKVNYDYGDMLIENILGVFKEKEKLFEFGKKYKEENFSLRKAEFLEYDTPVEYDDYEDCQPTHFWIKEWEV